MYQTALLISNNRQTVEHSRILMNVRFGKIRIVEGNAYQAVRWKAYTLDGPETMTYTPEYSPFDDKKVFRSFMVSQEDRAAVIERTRKLPASLRNDARLGIWRLMLMQ